MLLKLDQWRSSWLISWVYNLLEYLFIFFNGLFFLWLVSKNVFYPFRVIISKAMHDLLSLFSSFCRNEEVLIGNLLTYDRSTFIFFWSMYWLKSNNVSSVHSVSVIWFLISKRSLVCLIDFLDQYEMCSDSISLNLFWILSAFLSSEG